MQLGQEVPVGKIQKELKKLWESNDAVTKASLMNFAIYSEAPGSLEANTAMIEEITVEHACRALVIFARPDATAMEARAWITAHCRITGGGKKAICSEQIAFDLCGKCSSLVRNIVFANLESDLPLVIWWQGELTDRFDERFFSRIDRLIIDSGQWTDAPRQFQRLNSARTESGGRFLLHDLSWTRSFDLRVAIASLFDDTDLLKILPQLESIRISHNESGRACAGMFMAWMAEMMGFGHTSGGGSDFSVARSDDAKVEVTLQSAESERAISSLVLTFPECQIALELDDVGRFWHATGNYGERKLHRMFPALDQKPAALINAQLQRARENSLFKRVFPKLEAWL